MEKTLITKLLLGFVALIIGISLIGSIATSTNDVTETITISSESLDIASDKTVSGACPMGVNGTNEFSITNAPTGWKQAGCPISSFVITNGTGVTATVTTDYVFFTNNGSLFLVNTTLWSADCTSTTNTTTVSYVYCGDDYLTQAWQRTLLKLIAGFFALALLGTSVGIFYSIGKDTGIIN